MTKEEILAMKPGRELDALVAEHVFGWRKERGPKTDYSGPCESFDVLIPPTIEDPFPSYPPKGAIPTWYFCHAWSTDLLRVWEVAWHMNLKRGLRVLFGLTSNHEAWCGFQDVTDTMRFYYIQTTSMPLSICKAALLAVMEVEE